MMALAVILTGVAQAAAAAEPVVTLPAVSVTAGDGLPLSAGQEQLLSTVAGALSAHDAAAYLQRARADIREIQGDAVPMLAALPRNKQGRLDSPSARYALHRLFVARRGWRVMGVDPEGLAWNSSSAAEADILDQIPSAVSAALRTRLAVDGGLPAEEVPVLAATFEYLIHSAAHQRLLAVYKMFGLPIVNATSEEKVLQVADVFMASSILGYNMTEPSQESRLMVDLPTIGQVYPAWPKLQSFVREHVAAQRATTPVTGGALLEFPKAAQAMEKVGDDYGHWLSSECGLLKEKLVKIEDRGTGRVRLADFYGKNLNSGEWQFGESVSYLRQLGALDETHPGNKRVIIPNYITGLSNCLATMDHHTVCCISECEALMGNVERGIREPEADPETIATIVAGMPSATVPANRTLPALMLRRLHGIAQGNGGRVPIYGRLFAQWMHHAYPRECPYPHEAGSTNPMVLDDWVAETGKEYLASDEEIKAHAAMMANRRLAPLEPAPWVQKEELLVPPSHAQGEPGLPLAWGAIHGIAVVAAFATFLLGLVKMSCLARRGSRAMLGKYLRPRPAKFVDPDQGLV
jgi:hypothetical protein